MKNLFAGIKVIDFTLNVAGPAATAYLGDFGAEVIKIEKPKFGDDTRGFPPYVDTLGITYIWLNRNKKSLVVDMEDPEGMEVIRKLISDADVVVENFKPGTMDKFGLGYEDLKKINPKIIMCSVSGYGQTGPYKNKPGYDLIAQAVSGAMDMTGDPKGTPTKFGFIVGDYTAAYHAFGAIASSLYYRERTGQGQHIDISLLDCLVAMNSLVELAGLGLNPTRKGNHHPMLVPFGSFEGKNDSVIICAPNPKMWSLLCGVMGKPELIDNPLFNSGGARLKNTAPLVLEIETWLKTFDDIDQPMALMEKAGIPCAKICSTNDLLDNPQLISREMIVELETPDHLSRRSVFARGNPIKFSESKAAFVKAPTLGQHEIEILSSLGYDSATIDQLKLRWSVS